MGIYFRAETTRLSFVELWRMSSSFRVFLTACMNKVFHVKTPASWAIRHDDSIAMLEANKVPTHARRMLEPLINDFQQLGARLAFYHTLQTTKNLANYSVVLLPFEQNAVISCVWTRARITRPGREHAVCGLTSKLQDGTFLSTTNGRSPFDKPPGFKSVRWRRATPAELMRRHEEALAESSSWAIPVRNEQDAISILLEAKCRRFEWMTSRGVYVPLTPVEEARLGFSVQEEL